MSRTNDEDEQEHKADSYVFVNGPVALVASIIKQWQDDGEPIGDRVIIDAWKRLLSDIVYPDSK